MDGRRKLMSVGFFLSVSIACRTEPIADSANKEADGFSEASYADLQLLSPAKLQRYREASPKIAYEALNAIMTAPTTLWYDKEVMIGAYQDSVGDGPTAPIGARRNDQGRGLIDIIPRGTAFFSNDGKTWAFPFGHTAGTDRSDNIRVANFMHLPAENGRAKPVAYWTINQPRALGGVGLHKWRWMYPKGTIFGEMIYVADGNSLLALELRTRTRHPTGWATNVYRPFPTAASLAEAIKAKRPNWQSENNLNRMIAHLENKSTLVAKTLESSRVLGQGYYDLFNQSGYVDPLPAFGDPTLVRELLRETPFRSAYGQKWKEDGEKVAFAASTEEVLSVVPRRYDAGLIEVNEASCSRCHQDAGRPVRHFNSAAILYGDIWGEDQIFSFHPWDQDRIRGAGNDNRVVRSYFRTEGIVERYESSKHDARYYQEIKPRYDP